MDRDRRVTTALLAAALIISHVAVAITAYEYGQPDRDQGLPPVTGTHTATVPILAVSEDGEGVVGTVTVRIEPGSGRTYLDTNPFVQTDAQLSAATAKRVAAAYTNVSLAQSNVAYSFNISGQVIGGPSAGAAMTVATIAAITGQQVRDGVVITGTIEPDGSIGRVGGVLSKAYAAGRTDHSLFLVPEGQEQLLYYEEVVQQNRVGGLVFQDLAYLPHRTSINRITQRRFDMRTRAVSTIQEAARLMLQ